MPIKIKLTTKEAVDVSTTNYAICLMAEDSIKLRPNSLQTSAHFQIQMFVSFLATSVLLFGGSFGLCTAKSFVKANPSTNGTENPAAKKKLNGSKLWMKRESMLPRHGKLNLKCSSPRPDSDMTQERLKLVNDERNATVQKIKLHPLCWKRRSGRPSELTVTENSHRLASAMSAYPFILIA
ncbi:unnamed protein product [Victoria cruziana]